MSLTPEELAVELRRGVQPERTSLAWSRTLLVLAATFGVIGIHGYVSGVSMAIPATALVFAAAALLSGTLIAQHRLHSIHCVISEQRTVATAFPMLLVSLTVAFVALIALLAISSPSW